MKKGCCGCFLVIILVISILMLAITARAGIAKIPGFSYLFYELPKPTHEVKINSLDQYTKENIEPVIDQENQQLIINIPEETLTLEARQLLAMGSNAIFAPNLQVAVTKDYLEIFGLIQKPFNANVTIRFLPKIQDNHLILSIKEVKVGQLSLPPELITAYYSESLDKLANKLENLAFPGEISSINLADEELIIIAAIPQ